MPISLQFFTEPIKMDNVNQHIKDGDPTKEPILNMADFFAYLPFAYREGIQTPKYYDLIKHKYFERTGGWLRTGKVEL